MTLGQLLEQAMPYEEDLIKRTHKSSASLCRLEAKKKKSFSRLLSNRFSTQCFTADEVECCI